MKCNHILSIALLTSGCSTVTYVNADYEFAGKSVLSNGTEHLFSPMDDKTFAVDADNLTMVARPTPSGVVLMVKNNGRTPVHINWAKSRFLVSTTRGPLVDSAIAPLEGVALSSGGVSNTLIIDAIEPGEEIARGLTPIEQWYVHWWSEKTGNMINFYSAPRMKPLLEVQKRLQGNIDAASHISNIKAHQGDVWRLLLYVTQGDLIQEVSVNFVVAQAKASISAAQSY